MEQTSVVRLRKNSHAPCPKCGNPTAFFSGQEGTFASEERDFLADTVIKLECRVHGAFEIPAGELETEVARG